MDKSNHGVLEIPLTQEQIAVIDQIDADLTEIKWYADFRHGKFYARRSIVVNSKKGRPVYLHRVILERSIGRLLQKDEFADHINGDSLDNRRSNLRVATRAENVRNRKNQSNNTTGVKGVTWHKRDKKYRAQISVNGKRMVIGNYATIEEAAKAYAEASAKYHGEFGRTE